MPVYAVPEVVTRHKALMTALGRPPLPSLAGPMAEIAPVSAFERGSNFVIEVDVPGVDLTKGEVKVYALRNLIVIDIDKALPASPRLWGERRFGRRVREIAVPAKANPGRAKATYVNGVLTIIVPSAGAGQARKSIPIK